MKNINGALASKLKPPSAKKKKPQLQQYGIYDGASSSDSQSQIQPVDQMSSFQIEQQDATANDKNRENIDKLMDKLGLKQQVQNNTHNQLENVISDFVQNCIGSIDRQANTQQYDKIYDQLYQQKLKQKQSTPSSIFISELTQLQKINQIQGRGPKIIYRNFRLFLKYISMACQKIVQHPIFQGFILTVILLNSIKMATDDPLAAQSSLPEIESIFTYIYVVQMTLKVFAFGFLFNKGAYLRDLWNIMDFVIVVTSLLPLIINFGFSVSALRAVRVLRPLRTITKIRALKMIIRTLFNSFSLVIDSVYILAFIMFVFSIAGMQLFGGKLKFRCMNSIDGFITPIFCGTTADCSVGQLCVKTLSNPNFSIINFDTLLWSFLSVFQIITMEGWSQIMEYIQLTSGAAYGIYAVFIILICQFVLLNMTMAILKYKYAQVKGNAIEQEQQQKNQYEPQFLKKIGIYPTISVLSSPAPLIRTNEQHRKRVGCHLSLPAPPKSNKQGLKQLLAYVQQNTIKMSTKLNQPLQKGLDLQQLKQLGKVQDVKWQVNNLQFQTNNLSDHQVGKDKQGDKQDDQNDADNKEQNQDSFSDSFISQLEEQDQSSQSQKSDDNTALLKLNMLSKAQQFQRRKDPQSAQKRNAIQSKNYLQSQKQLKPRPSAYKQISVLDNILQLLGSKPGKQQSAENIFEIEDIDLDQIKPEVIYQRFADLGVYGIKKAATRVQFANLKVGNKPRAQKMQEKKKKISPVQQVFDQNVLDIKQLHLKNQLEKTQLKVRVKSDQLIQEQRTYDLTRVLASQQLKAFEKKKEELIQNMNSTHFNIKYNYVSLQKHQQHSRAVIYSRNLQNQKSVLNVPQLAQVEAKKSKNEPTQQQKNTQKNKGNTQYLRLLQNHNIGQKVQMTLDRITAVFFKQDTKQKKQQQNIEQQPSPQEQYDLFRQQDVLQRHGHLQLDSPCAMQFQSTVNQINMKPQEYQINIRGLFGMFTVIRKKTLLFASHAAYDNFVLVLVLLNTVTMAMSGFVDTDQPPYSYISQTFTIAFTLDLAIKVFAYGMSFFGDAMNLFDAVVVAISMVEISTGTGANLSALRSIRILRAFRVLRITRLIRSLSYMRIVIGVVSSIINEFVYVFLLLFLFIFIYTLLGMQIFGGNFPQNNVTGIRQNFDTFFYALFSIFQVMTVENWDDLQTQAANSSLGPWGILFFISWIFLGNWILLNLLQAILLDGFDDDATQPDLQMADQVQPQQAQTQANSLVDKNEQQQIKQTETDQQQSQQGQQIQFDQDDASLFLFQPDNPVRLFALAVISSKPFQIIIFIAIISSSAKLAFDTYLPKNDTSSLLAQISDILDYVFNFLFIFQAALKIIGSGFVAGQKAYLKNSWNKLDFLIVSTSILDMLLKGVNLSIIKLLRTLRPLRIITRNEDMRIMVSSLVQSMIGIINVLLICMCVFLMFAILGMNLLQGKLNYCNTEGEKLVTGNYGPYGVNQQKCGQIGGVWTTHLINFQNIATSMMSLYVFSTRQNWPFYTFTFIDSSQQGPVKDNSQILYFIFVVLFIFIGSLFFMDLLVGVMFMNYHQAQRKVRLQTLSHKQINWKNLQKIIVSQNPNFQLHLPPQNTIRKLIWSIISTKIFEIVIALVIIVNIVAMAINDDDISPQFAKNLTTLNSICSFLFIGQLSLKLIVYGRHYFSSGWNMFDFFVVAASILDLIMDYAGVNSTQASAITILLQIARIFRVLRITRLLRMFKSFKGLQKLIQTFIFSLPAIFKGLSILCLYLFISSVLASYLMGDILKDFGGSMNSILNYQDFHHAFQTLFTNLTGQNWYYYMFYSTKQGYVECSDGSSTGCISALNYVFWLSFQFLGQKVFLQLFVLIILDQFENNYINQHNPMGTFALLQDDFRDNWIETTTKYRSEKIQSKRLIDLMLLLRPPLGLARSSTLSKYEDELRQNDKMSQVDIKNKINQMDRKMKKNAARLLHKMNVMKNRIYFGYHQTFYYFAKNAILAQFIDQATSIQKQQLQALHKQSEQALQKLKPQGNLFYYQQLQEQQQSHQPLNPISLILFTQMIMKSWHNYSLKVSSINSQQNNQREQEFNSLNNSCVSQVQQAKYEKITGDKKAIMRRRGGFIQNKGAQQGQTCQFKPTPNLASFYSQGKRTRFHGKNSEILNKALKRRQSKNYQERRSMQGRKSIEGRRSIDRKRSGQRKNSGFAQQLIQQSIRQSSLSSMKQQQLTELRITTKQSAFKKI